MPNGFLINEPTSKCAASSEDLEQTPRSIKKTHPTSIVGVRPQKKSL